MWVILHEIKHHTPRIYRTDAHYLDASFAFQSVAHALCEVEIGESGLN